jgi:hypothetical protein
VDYIVRGRYHRVPKHPQVLEPDRITALTQTAASLENLGIAGAQVPGAVPGVPTVSQVAARAQSGLQEIKA